MKTLSKTFCILPWIHRFTNIGGEVQICCTSEEYKTSYITDKNGQRINAAAGLDDSEILNTAFMKKLRLEMLDGKWPSACERCRVTEWTGSQSRRQTENKHFENFIPEALDGTKQNGEIEVKVRSVDYRLGNLCNLACRMCSPRASKKWITEWKKMKQVPFSMSVESEKEFLSYDWYKNPEFIENAKKIFSSIKHLHFAGGEPLLISEMATLLKACVEGGHSSEIELSYNTNLTSLPKAVIELWPRFKGVKILASIDGCGKLNEYIRHHSKWEIIDRNLEYLETNFDRLKLINVHVMCTVQAYNIFDLTKLFSYLSKFKKIDSFPHLIDLHFPVNLRTQVLPPEAKTKISKELNDLYENFQCQLADPKRKFPSHAKATIESIRGIISFMNCDDKSSELVSFYRATTELDKLRNQSLTSIVPGWQNIFDTFRLRQDIDTSNRDSKLVPV